MNRIFSSKVTFIILLTPALALFVSDVSAQSLFKNMVDIHNTDKPPTKSILAKAAKKPVSQLDKDNIAPAATVGTPSSSSPSEGAVNFTLPNLGQGFSIIPTPTYHLLQVLDKQTKFGLESQLWANSLGVDSSMQKLVSSLLSPQISQLGLQIQGNWMFTPAKKTADLNIGAALELNLLIKKVSYYDSSTKATTNFNPFAIHSRLGLISSFANNQLFLDAYINQLTILTQNNQFVKFSGTSKTTFFFPEVDAAAIFPVNSGSTQYLRFEFDMLVNNGETQTLYNSGDKVIPYVKLGFVTSL
jgi:hypothetical protein